VKNIKLAVLPGDGIGQEVTLSAIPVFDALQIPVEINFGDIGWEFWKVEGTPVPDRTWKLIESSDATLVGAVTSKPEREAKRELSLQLQKSSEYQYVSPVIQLRQRLDLYANVRPCFNIRGEGENFNFSIIRENTEGLYAGFDFHPIPAEIKSLLNEVSKWESISSEEISCSLRLQSQSGLNRLFNFAFSYAQQKNLSRLTFADKPNVLRQSSAFAREIFESVSEKYPHIKADILNVDAVALWMTRRPQEFGVIVAENMFGDILSDLGAGIMGGLGFAASANMGIKGCYFEPVHGSAPRIKPNCANPSAMFLTIALMLENFGYPKEAIKIKNAVKYILKEGHNLTYDLGGNASTQSMANTIINYCLNPRKTKLISFLSTGNEIIEGEMQDKNAFYFSNHIKKLGGSIYQHIVSSDKKFEIINALKYLLSKCDAVVITGGLGPTSDDLTRFALEDFTKNKLQFSEEAWIHIAKRLKRFHLPVNESNRQQALFPSEAELYANEHGTAFGCCLKWEDKHIFMLPGPPKECHPMFDRYIMPTLKKLNFFKPEKTYHWVTLGLIEGEIAPQIDSILNDCLAKVAYRWHYPYLDIKIFAEIDAKIDELIKSIEKILADYVISNDGRNAHEVLLETLSSAVEVINVVDQATEGQYCVEVAHPKLHFPKNFNLSDAPIFLLKSSQSLKSNKDFTGTIRLECEGYIKRTMLRVIWLGNCPNL
jgi:isocitrate dehydrogenase